jgi:CRISPR-associated protein Csx16
MTENVRLVGFLGTGQYSATRYFWPGFAENGVETPYVVFALARMLSAGDVHIACTEAALKMHGERLRAEFTEAGLVSPRFEILLDGKTTDELWENFSRLTTLVAAPGAREVVLDITHGFRSQPFFAGAVLSFVRALGRSDADTRVVYAAFDGGDLDDCTPIWDLTPFVHLVDWTHAIRQFVTTGDARAVSNLSRRIGHDLSKKWATNGMRGQQPRLPEFVKALTEFSEALMTVRVGELLLQKRAGPSAAKRLAKAAEIVREELRTHATPLAEVLGEIEAMTRSLVHDGDHLAGVQGARVMAALARLYLRLGRYAEAAIALREGWVNLYASREACRPGFDDYDENSRKEAERCWTGLSDSHKPIANVRNDIEHGGFRKRPQPATAIRNQLERLVTELEQVESLVARPATARTMWFVSRHPGAREWAARKGIRVDRTIAHLDIAEVRAGDTVIGTLPVNLAAEVCRRGARYVNLSLDVPEELRGRELSADELERCGARLEPFVIERA